MRSSLPTRAKQLTALLKSLIWFPLNTHSISFYVCGSLSLSLSLSLTIITQALQKGNPTFLHEGFGAQEFLSLEYTSVACAAGPSVNW
jgi:hypothetical protein